jgi:hypothetical protein
MGIPIYALGLPPQFGSHESHAQDESTRRNLTLVRFHDLSLPAENLSDIRNRFGRATRG